MIDSSGMSDRGDDDGDGDRDGDGDGGGEGWRPGVIPLRPLRLADITDGAVATLRRHAAVVFGASAVVALAGAVLVLLAETYVLPPRQSWRQPVNELLANGASLLVTLSTYALVVGVMTVVLSRAVPARPVVAREVWAEVRPRLLPLLGLTVVVTVVTMVGLFLLVVPGIVAYVLLSLAVPALMWERSTVAEALKRSVSLVWGAWWRVFGLLAVGLLITVLVSLVVQLLFAQLLPLGAGTSPMPDGTLAGHRLILGLGNVAAQTLAVPFGSAVTALIYLDRRMRRENLDVELRRAAE